MTDSPTFRDSIPTVDESGRRVWMYPRKPPTGKHASKEAVNWYRLRTYVSWVLLVILVVGPFVKIAGNPLLMFNIVERKFSILGLMFYPQDFYLFALAMITAFVMCVFFTALYGRLFCGWVCPQTIFMEMVFRKIEYLIEGDSSQQKALNAMEWTPEKIRKKAIKHSIFFLISFVVANLLLGYIIGGDALLKLISESPLDHSFGFFCLFLFTLLFYAIFARFREQACTFICPYGRFQSVMLDENSLVVAYDHVRGEERGRKTKGQSWEERLSIGKGDCVDCDLCVKVCPTGIDIRNGTQMECVNCTNCIDACNSVMSKVGRDPGLIRYASMDMIEGRSKGLKWTPRLKVYGTFMGVMIVLLTGLLLARNAVHMDLLRVRGTWYQVMPDGHVTNMFEGTFHNKSGKELTGELRLLDHEGQLLYGQPQIVMAPQEETKTIVVVTLEPEELEGKETPVKIGLFDGDRKLDIVTATFLVPAPGEDK